VDDATTAPLRRTAARVVLLDNAGRTLLFHGADPDRPELGTWWFTPGGGLDPGEDLETAARREVLEETGFGVAELGPPVLQRVAEFTFEGQRYVQDETFFLVRVPTFDVDDSRWTDIERRSVLDYRWWTVEELLTTSQTVYPAELHTLLH
jgi:8-oxo-dGTP pyrophosphatase MutT (NUDIX family)